MPPQPKKKNKLYSLQTLYCILVNKKYAIQLCNCKIFFLEFDYSIKRKKTERQIVDIVDILIKL